MIWSRLGGSYWYWWLNVSPTLRGRFLVAFPAVWCTGGETFCLLLKSGRPTMARRVQPACWMTVVNISHRSTYYVGTPRDHKPASVGTRPFLVLDWILSPTDNNTHVLARWPCFFFLFTYVQTLADIPCAGTPSKADSPYRVL